MMPELSVDTIFPNGLNVDDAIQLIWPVAIYVIGMALYAVFVFKFYRFVATRDMFTLKLSGYEESRRPWMRSLVHLSIYGARYLLLFPAFAFFWFLVLTLILSFLAKERALSDILLISAATVSAIRVAAYYNEDLSRDLAKILPFAVLGIFLVDASFFEIDDSLDVLAEAGDHRETIFYYLLLLIAVEFVLRLAFGIFSLLFLRRGSSASGHLPVSEDRETEAGEQHPELQGPRST